MNAVADRIGAGVAKALLGKGVLLDKLPWVTGCIGILGTEPSYDMMMYWDTLLMIGTGFPCAEFLPKESQARALQMINMAELITVAKYWQRAVRWCWNPGPTRKCRRCLRTSR